MTLKDDNRTPLETKVALIALALVFAGISLQSFLINTRLTKFEERLFNSTWKLNVETGVLRKMEELEKRP